MVRILFSCLLFSLGFSAVFVLVGIGVGVAGRWLRAHEAPLNVVFGLIVMFFGLFVMGVVRLPFLYRDRRLRMGGSSFGVWGAPALGFAFGFGWTPCVGPYIWTLISVTAGETPARSALLFGLFSLTLATCFTAAGLLFAKALRAFAFLQRNHRAIEIISGAVLVIIGVLLVAQLWDNATAYVNRMLAPLVAPLVKFLDDLVHGSAVSAPLEAG